MPNTTANQTTNPQPATDLNDLFATMAQGKKKSSFVGDTRDFIGETARFFVSVSKTATLGVDSMRAEMYADMTQREMEVLANMRAYGM